MKAFLRSPSFAQEPYALSRVAAGYDWWRVATGADCDAGGRDQVADWARAIATERIGGDFWAGCPAEVVEFLDHSQGSTIIAGRANVAPSLTQCQRTVILLPEAVRAARVVRLSDNVLALSGPVDPWALIGRARRILLAGPAEIGLAAVAAGVPTHCIYNDGKVGPALPRIKTFAVLNAALAAATYRSPYDGGDYSLAQIIAYLGEWRRRLDRTQSIACLSGIASWKRRRIRRILVNGPNLPIRNRASSAVRAAKGKGAIAYWASRMPTGLEEQATRSRISLYCIEDGFLRSTGLGAALILPASLTLDSTGVHYDPTRPSDLETLLQTFVCNSSLLARSRSLIDRLRAASITKYNLGGDVITLPSKRRMVLVPGQVADDMSVALAGRGMTMAELLERVRLREPDSFIIYKPHPDVVAGLRRGALDGREAGRWADLVLEQANLAALLERVDAVHTLSSLTGFEALLRNREVVVHGQPFYAGWGLTRDLAPLARRSRVLTLEQLVAGALISYPLYADPKTGLPCSVEHVVDCMVRETKKVKAPDLRARLAAFWVERRPIGAIARRR